MKNYLLRKPKKPNTGDLRDRETKNPGQNPRRSDEKSKINNFK